MAKTTIFLLVGLILLGLTGCASKPDAPLPETPVETVETSSAEIETTTEVEQEPFTVSVVKDMNRLSNERLELREGPSFDYDVIYSVDFYSPIIAYDFQDNCFYTEIDGCYGWCRTDDMIENNSYLYIQGKETSAFSEMKSYLGKTVGDIKQEFGNDFTTEVRGKAGPFPCMIYDSTITPYIFYFRRADNVQGGHENASDNTDIIKSVACEQGNIHVLLNIEIGDSLNTVFDKIGQEFEVIPYKGPGIGSEYTQEFVVLFFNEYRVRLVFGADTQILERITIADKNYVAYQD